MVWYYENSDIPQVLESAASLIDKYIVQLDNSPKMNKIKWGYTANFDIKWMKTTMEKRFAWMNANYKTLTDIAQPQMVNIDRTVSDGSIVFDVYNNTGAPINAKVYVAEYSGTEFKNMSLCNAEVVLSEGQRSGKYSFAKTPGCDNCSIYIWEDNLRPVSKKIKFEYK